MIYKCGTGLPYPVCPSERGAVNPERPPCRHRGTLNPNRSGGGSGRASFECGGLTEAAPRRRCLRVPHAALRTQVFKGGLSSFTVVNMVAALLQHEAAAGARRLPRLPPRPRHPSTHRMYASLRPEDLPEDLAQLARLDAGASARLGYAMVQSASAGWHLPAATLLEQHAHACAPLTPTRSRRVPEGSLASAQWGCASPRLRNCQA